MSAKRVNKMREQAGAEWARLRTERDWGQKEVSQETAKFGPDNFISVSQLSRIEKGQFDRVSLDDAVTLGQVFGLTPNRVAEMYGLYHDREQAMPDALFQAEMVLSSLPEDLREYFLADIRMFASSYVARSRERGEVEPTRQRRKTEPPASEREKVAPKA